MSIGARSCAHNVSAGRITVDEPCVYDGSSAEPGLGWGSKYYVEGRPNLLDTPGEWWYDAQQPASLPLAPSAGSPAGAEPGDLPTGHLASTSAIVPTSTLDGLTLEFFNESAIYQSNSATGSPSYDNTVRNNATVRYANRGLYLGQEAGRKFRCQHHRRLSS